MAWLFLAVAVRPVVGAETVTVAMSAGATWHQTLGITNAGTEALMVSGVVSSCECLQATVPTNTIPPGGVGELSVVLKPATTGELAYVVTAATTAGNWTWMLSVTVTAPSPVRIAEAYADLAALRDGQASGKTYTLVDVRSPEAYAAAHIPDSLNIPRTAVKSKSFLRDTPVVLVDAGWGDVALESEWQRLREIGFADVCILQGGVNAWKTAGGDLEGGDVGAVNMMTSYEVRSAQDMPDWVIVVADTTELPRLDEALAAYPRIPFGASNEVDFVREVKARADQAGPTARVLVLTSNGQGYPAIADALRGQMDAPVFFAEYGLIGLQRARDVVAVAAGGGVTRRNTDASMTSGPDAPKPCGTCPGRRGP